MRDVGDAIWVITSFIGHVELQISNIEIKLKQISNIKINIQLCIYMVSNVLRDINESYIVLLYLCVVSIYLHDTRN